MEENDENIDALNIQGKCGDLKELLNQFISP